MSANCRAISLCKLATLLCMVCVTCRAYCDLSAVEFESGLDEEFARFTGMNQDEHRSSQLTPVHLMIDNAQLFRAAEAEKDAEMTIVHRILNNEWLAKGNDIYRHDARILRTFIRRNVVNFLRSEAQLQAAKYREYKATRKIELSDPRYQDYMQFTTLDNYRFDISDDEVKLHFYFAFN